MRRPYAPSISLLLLNVACPSPGATTTDTDGTDGTESTASATETTTETSSEPPPTEGSSEATTQPTTATDPTDSTSVGPATDGGAATIAITIAGDGTVLVDPPGETCGDPACEYMLPGGSLVALTATPAAGSLFAGWSGDCSGAEPMTEIDIGGGVGCTATFELLPEGALPAALSASDEIVRVPADDAPASDSETLLKVETAVALTGVTWTVFAADDGSEVASSDELEFLFTCPDGRRDYDVRATITDGQVQSTLFERRLVTCVPPRSDAGRTVHLADLADGSYFQNGEIDGVNVMPGDLVRISGSTAGDFAFFNFQGSAEAPIHIINDGPVTNQDTSWLLHLINCQHVIVDGRGSDDVEYGFTLTNPGAGGQAVFVRNYTQGSNTNTGSTDIEMFGIEIADGPDSGFRIWNGGSDDYDADNWTFHNLRLHHNYVHDVLTEGFYVGYYTDNVEQQPPPYPLVDAKVYRNRVDNAGWDGMQFGSCRGGLEVHDNVVTGSGGANEPNQRSSLQWNPGNSGAVYNNRFIGGLGVDLQVGCTGGDTLMFSNVFVHSEGGFYLHAGQADAPRYWLFGNTVGTPNAAGLRINMNSNPGTCGAGAKLSEMHYASNLLVGAVAEAWEFAAGNADTASWTVEPNLAFTGAPGELCLDDELAPTCADSGALAGGGAALADLGLTAADLPGGHYVDVDGRVLAGPANFGAHQAPVN
ncbi:InlB B-repeat-containing protein [Nannocystis radixulma]|uniref:Bacterial repeat domain-containing protein n=1 Tax=Nannocystis radixulma TaxID=2995305 RepID=A0ABT5B0R3_9BACT|nr:hypothetical protein [Nannocystis radixulma]MDC0667682.1 hypothetical protein [Nannocystis radixulma]